MPVYLLGVIPLLDMILPRQQKLSNEKVEEMKSDNRYEQLLILWALCYIGFEVLMYWLSMDFTFWKLMYMSFANGILSVQSFSVAHELLHKKENTRIALSNLILTFNGYLHFYKSHKNIHHAYVATERDPSSAPKGMTLYEFVPKSVIGNLKWLLQEQPFFMSWVFIIYAMIIYNLFVISTNMFLFWSIQSMIAVILLETVNYIEHYGLRRVGKQSSLDSWDTDFTFMNWVTFRLGFHSHHHLKAKDEYQILNHQDNSLKMPYDYPIMMFISLFPSLFFKVTHPHLVKLLTVEVPERKK